MAELAEKEKILEAVIAEIEEIQKLEKKGDAKPFFTCSLDFAVKEAPKRFGHIPAIMEAYHAALKEYNINSFDTTRFGQHPDFNIKVSNAISEYFRPIIEHRIVNLMKMMIDENDLAMLKALTQAFLRRPDLEKPFEDWQHHCTFPIKINEKQYQCTLVADPRGRQNVSFILESEIAKKGSVRITLKPGRWGDHGFSESDLTAMEIYGAAENLVNNFYELNKRLHSIRTKEKYGNLNVPAIALKLVTGQQVTPDDTDDPAAVIALDTEMWQISGLSQGLSAYDYAATVASTEELQQIIPNRQLFMAKVMQGILQLFKQVLVSGSGNMDPSEEDIKTAYTSSNNGGNNMLNAPLITSLEIQKNVKKLLQPPQELSFQ